MLSLALGLALAQVDMTPLLNRGPMVLVEEGKGGKFGQASSVVLVDAPVDVVWAVVSKPEEFKNFMPHVTTSEVMKRSDPDVEVHFVIEVPGPDTDYTVRYTPNAATHSMEGSWVKGDLKGSSWLWKCEPAPGGKTLLTHQLAVKNFSGLAQSFDDDSQTITVGLNVSSALAASKAVKRRCEEQVKTAAAAPAASGGAAPAAKGPQAP